MGDGEWFPIVSEVYSSKEAIKDRDKLFEHYFTVDYEDTRPIKLLRIDIQDRFYLKDFSLIYTATNERINGTEAGDDFRFRFICPVKKGNYKIVTKGGKYCYSVFMLESNLKLQYAPICKVRSPFDVLVSQSVKEDALHRRVAFRKVGTTEWEIADMPTKKVLINLDPTSAYEVKMKLFAGDLFKTEYSPTATITSHQVWADQFEPNIDFFNTTLLFEIQTTKSWLSNLLVTLQYKTINSTNSDWIRVTNQPLSVRDWKMDHSITWDLEDRLYDQLLTQDMTIEWQLEFINIKTSQIAVSQVRILDLRKRHKLQRGENIKSNKLLKFDSLLSMSYDGRDARSMYLTRDSQFWFRQQTLIPNSKQYYYVDFSGDYTLERKNPTDKKCTITLMNIKFRNLHAENSTSDEMSTRLLPELVKFILGFVWGLPHSNKLMTDVSVNLVCKHWCHMFADGLLQIEGELMDDYNARRVFGSIDALTFVDWERFVLLDPINSHYTS